VPIAITAFTASMLKDKQITDVSGLGRLTPNVNLDTSSGFGGSNQVLSASIRGIGQDDFAINLDPGVGVYVDGVYYARTTGANVNMLDVDRLEILKGPQGTLFGRNTIGGAISVVTRTPGDAYTASVQVTDHRRYGAQHLDVLVPEPRRLPEADTLSRDGLCLRSPRQLRRRWQ
jgi:iron complex outermembrane receptor protein